MVLKPANITFEQAASVPIAGITALQGVRDKGKVQPGQKVLINGASGGVGTFAVQIAKSFGADVTGVCSTRNRGHGPHQSAQITSLITRKEDFTKSAQRYDVMIDLRRQPFAARMHARPDSQGHIRHDRRPRKGQWILLPMDKLVKAKLLSALRREPGYRAGYWRN